ncbi:MAG TPA: ABC transporter permease [Terriglobia bacterium]|nr:ABC transporter permease [Terriglobia bacterium]
MATVLQDLRYGVRVLARNPGFTAVAILALALGIGANTAIFSVVNAVLLRPLPYPDSDRLVTLWGTKKSAGFAGPITICEPDYPEWRDQNRVFDAMAGFRWQTANLTGAAEPARLIGFAVTSSFFPLMGARPALGRAFSPDEERAGHDNVVLLSHSLWQNHFGSDPSVVGKPVTLDDRILTVAGVMPEGFAFPNQADYWTPAVLATDCHNTTMRVIARLKPGVKIERAREDVAVIAQRLGQDRHRPDPGWTWTLVRLQDEMSSDLRPSLFLLLGAVGVVLLIACANVANLLLARASTRQREIAIRSALGASRARVIRQMLTESLLLALAGGALGLMAAGWSRDLLVSLLPHNLAGPGLINRIVAVRLDGWVLGFTLLISVVTGLIFGLAPALEASNLGVGEALKEGARSSSGLGRGRLRNTLVVAEMALALVLLVGAGLLMRSFARLTSVDPGFSAVHLLSMNVELPDSRYQTAGQMIAFERQALARLASLPGVEHAGAVFGLPFGETLISGDISVEGQPSARAGARKLVVSSDYFQTLGMPLVKGRFFNDHDTENSPQVLIISQSVANHLWPHDDPIGRHIDPSGNTTSNWYTVVGVVGDVKQRSLDETLNPVIYTPYAQSPIPFMMQDITFVVRTAPDPAALIGPARRAIDEVDPNLPVFDAATMSQLVSQTVDEPRFNTFLLGVFATLAVLLAMVGIYGVMSYATSQRTHEIGIRMALGAEREDVLKLVVGQGIRLTLAGVGIGLAGAFALTRLLAKFLYGVGPLDLATFAGAAVLITAVALLAAYIPARRATRVDPMVALRYE